MLRIEDRGGSDFETMHLEVISMWVTFSTENVDEIFQGKNLKTGVNELKVEFWKNATFIG